MASLPAMMTDRNSFSSTSMIDGKSTPNREGRVERPRKSNRLMVETRILILGSQGVGKTALIVRFLTRRFIGEYDHSTEMKYKMTTLIDDDNVTMEILDPRQDFLQSRSASDDAIKWADGFIFVYSITCRHSLDHLKQIYEHVTTLRKSTSIPGLIIGHKSDLVHQRHVTVEQGKTAAKEMDLLFVELSAADQIQEITDAFHTLYRHVASFKRRSRSIIDKMRSLFDKSL